MSKFLHYLIDIYPYFLSKRFANECNYNYLARPKYIVNAFIVRESINYSLIRKYKHYKIIKN